MKKTTKMYLINFFGSQVNLANQLSIPESNMSDYLNSKKALPLKHALHIVELTNGGCKLNELCPLQKKKK